MEKNLPAMWETWVQSLGWEDSPGGGHSNPLQYSYLENPMDRGAWQATVHGVTKSRRHLSISPRTRSEVAATLVGAGSGSYVLFLEVTQTGGLLLGAPIQAPWCWQCRAVWTSGIALGLQEALGTVAPAWASGPPGASVGS